MLVMMVVMSMHRYPPLYPDNFVCDNRIPVCVPRSRSVLVVPATRALAIQLALCYLMLAASLKIERTSLSVLLENISRLVFLIDPDPRKIHYCKCQSGTAGGCPLVCRLDFPVIPVAVAVATAITIAIVVLYLYLLFLYRFL